MATTPRAPAVDIQTPGADKSAKVSYANVNNDDDKPHEAVARLGKVGNLEVIEFEIKPDDPGESQEKPEYVSAIIRHADAKTVTADALDVNWLKNYLTDHPKELSTKNPPNGNDITITASTDSFQKFLLKHAKDEGAFTATHWVRPGSATQPATLPGG